MRKLYMFFLLSPLVVLLISTGQSFGQSGCGDETLNEAQKRYETGNFDQVLAAVLPCIVQGFNDRQKLEGYKLVSMSYLAMDSLEKAQWAAMNLLTINPNYEPAIFDPPKFIRIINQIKESGSAQIVRSVSKKAENLYEAPGTVIILTDKEIKERGYTDMEAMFSDLPGFDISRNYSSIYSNLYQRGYRSNETNRTIFLIDGVEENNLWSNTAYWDMQYPLSNVSKVEVIYGPASTMYGANAFAGVVNVITKEPEEITHGKSFGVSAQTGYGTYATKYGDITLAGKHKSISFTLTGRFYQSDERNLSEFKDYDYNPDDYNSVNYKSLLNVTSNAQNYYTTNGLNDTSLLYQVIRDGNNVVTALMLTDSGQNMARSLDKKAITNKTFNGHPLEYSALFKDWLVHGKLRIGDFTMGFQRWRGVHGTTNMFNDNNISGYLNGSEFEPVQNFFYARYEKNLNDKLVISNNVQLMVHELDNGTSSLTLNNYSNGKKKLADLAKGAAPNWVQIYLYQISKQLRDEFKVIYSPTPRFDLVSGVEVRNSLLQGNYLISPREYPSDSGYVGGSQTNQGGIMGGNTYDIKDFGFYSQGNYQFHKDLKFTLGGRVDYNKIRKLGGYGTQFNPRVAIVYTPKQFVFKAIYSEAMKDADNWTKFATTEFRKLPSPSLEPEKARNLEVSAGYNPGKNLYASVNVFSTSYSGVIGTKEVPYQGGTTTQNAPIGSMSIQGLESQFTWQAGDYHFFGNYTFILKTESEANGITSTIGDISKHKANLGVNAKYFNSLNVNLRMNYIGERETGPGTTVPLNPGKFPAHTILHAAIGYEFGWGLMCQLVCDNILNTDYSDPGVRNADGNYYGYYTPQKERTLSVKLIYDLSK